MLVVAFLFFTCLFSDFLNSAAAANLRSFLNGHDIEVCASKDLSAKSRKLVTFHVTPIAAVWLVAFCSPNPLSMTS